MKHKQRIPRTPAAFINIIAESGTKAEAVKYLQQTWDERCQLERRVAVLEFSLRKVSDLVLVAYDEDVYGEDLRDALKAIHDLAKQALRDAGVEHD